MASSSRLILFQFLSSSPLCSSSRTNQRSPTRLRCCSSPPAPSQTESSSSSPIQQHKLIARRSMSVALILLQCMASCPIRVDAGGLFDKYVKRKKLDPLEAYIPVVLLTQEQFKDLEKSFDLDQPNYDVSRSLLRSGPASSLRINIRAVAQYASDDGKGKSASQAVDECLRALEELDALLLLASRNDSTASVVTMKSKIDAALGALDSLLETVPADILDKGRAIADAYREASFLEEYSKPEMDKDIRELEAIL